MGAEIGFIVIVLAVFGVGRLIYDKRSGATEDRLKAKYKEYDGSPVRCPVCGCSSVQLLQGSFKTTALWFMVGWVFCLFGGGQPRNYCQRCGYKWKPGK